MRVKVSSIGHTKFGRNPKPINELIKDVAEQATKDIPINSIDKIILSNFSSGFIGQCHLNAITASALGIHSDIMRVESACASGGIAIKEAFDLISSGLYNQILVIGVEKMTQMSSEKATQILSHATSEGERAYGMSFPTLFALMARRHFYEFGTNEEDLAKISVKNHNNALLNEVAQYHKKISIDDVMNSNYIASPLKLLDCSPFSDGAASILLTHPDITTPFDDDKIYLTGSGLDIGPIELYNRKSITSLPSVIYAAKSAMQQCSLSPKDIDFAELHDCFTIAELLQIEDIGFCKKGEAKRLINDEEIGLDGFIPINPSGGLKAKGHPVGATGISQAVEVVKQLRGEADKRQISDVQRGLCCNIGGSGASAVVSIFERG